MPEVAAVLLVLMFALGLYIAGRLQGTRPLSDERVEAELEHVRQNQDWLAERLLKARAEKWDADIEHFK